MNNNLKEPINIKKAPMNTPRRKLNPRFFKELLAGTPIYKLRGVSPKNLDITYSYAKECYEEQDYEKALRLFQVVVFYDSSHKRAWLGAGACLENLKQYSQAIQAYACASYLDPENVTPVVQSVNCFLALNDTKMALTMLSEVITLTEEKEDHLDSLKKHAVALKKTLAAKTA